MTEEKILTNDGIEEIDFTEPKEEIKQEQEPEQVPEKPKFKPLPVNKEAIPEPREIPKEVKKQEIKNFNENPRTKDFGVKLISKRTLVSFYVIIGILLLLFFVNMVWYNSNWGKIANKDFGSTINNEIYPPNITAEFTEGANNIYIYNNYSTTNNITLNATFILPNDITIKVQNLTQ